MEIIAEDVTSLTKLAAMLKSHRNKDELSNKMYEAAADWRGLGDLMLTSHPDADLSSIMRVEEALYADLQQTYGHIIHTNTDYTRVMALGAHIIAECSKRLPNPDGFLGCKRIIPQVFSYLVSDFCLQFDENPEGPFAYVTTNVQVQLDLPISDSGCYVSVLQPQQRYCLEDILFLAGQPEGLVAPPSGGLKTETEAEAWFTKIAMLLREYTGDILANKPGAWERLAAASAERERLYIEWCEQQWLLNHPGEPLPE